MIPEREPRELEHGAGVPYAGAGAISPRPVVRPLRVLLVVDGSCTSTGGAEIQVRPAMRAPAALRVIAGRAARFSTVRDRCRGQGLTRQ